MLEVMTNIEVELFDLFSVVFLGAKRYIRMTDFSLILVLTNILIRSVSQPSPIV